jgi:glycosyltransferase involved in cell wall biosynthesis
MEDLLARIASFQGKNTAIAPKAEVVAKPSIKVETCDVHTSVVIFSKDRPYQLTQLLDSLPANDKTIVLYADPKGQWKEGYDIVQKNYPDVDFVLEADFTADLLCILRSCSVGAAHATSCVLFCVDDLLFFAPVDLESYSRDLVSNPSAWTVHLKLHAGIVYSHTRDIASAPPALQAVARSRLYVKTDDTYTEQLLLLRYRLEEAHIEWRYPFDLCGSLYRTTDVLALLSTKEPSLLASPNLLELNGNAAFWKEEMNKKYYYCLCVSSPVLSVVTVNRVQTDFHSVPIYSTAGGDIDCLNSSNVRPLDRRAYRTDSTTMSVHVGSLHFQDSVTYTSAIDVSAIKVTVLVPMYNASQFLQQTLESLRLPQGCAFEVLFVDDGSIDNTVELVLDFMRVSDTSISSEEDTRNAVICGSFDSHHGEEIPCRLLKLEHVGLPIALDKGLVIANEFTARLDADDELEPNRLLRQLEFLQVNETIQVVGAQALLVKQQEYKDNGNNENSWENEHFLAKGIYTHPVSVSFSMLFSCPVIHPTVMMRTATAVGVGGYSGMLGHSSLHVDKNDYCPVEDYRLWLKILEIFPRGICNIPSVALRLRRRDDSKSSVEASVAAEAAAKIRHKAVASLLGKESLTLMEENALNSLAEPSRWLHSSENAEEALKLLERIYVLHSKECGDLPHDERRNVFVLLQHHSDQISRKVRGVAAAKKFRLSPSLQGTTTDVSSAMKESIVQSVLMSQLMGGNSGGF